jgi:hypothetical protein
MIRVNTTRSVKFVSLLFMLTLVSFRATLGGLLANMAVGYYIFSVNIVSATRLIDQGVSVPFII